MSQSLLAVGGVHCYQVFPKTHFQNNNVSHGCVSKVLKDVVLITPGKIQSILDLGVPEQNAY